jgi:phosphate transport system permease protein
MTIQVGSGHPGAAPVSVLQRSGNATRRHIKDRVITGVLFLALVLALVPLALILFVVIRDGIGAMSWDFLSKPPPFSFREEGGGFVNGLIGTAYMIVIATVLSIPLGIGSALFLVEFRSSWLTKPVRFFTDVMTGVPSVFVGLFVFTLLVRGNLGFGTFVGGVALAFLMLPIVARSAEEVLRLVPSELRNASYALGARRWQTVFRVVLPTAAPGLITGSMLAVARAAGEAAPLILTALGAFDIVWAFQDGSGQAALPLQILDGARNPFPAGQERAWAGALELMLFVLLLTVTARLIGRRTRARR